MGGTSFTGKTSNWTSVCYGNGKFVVIGTKENSSYNDDSYIAYSTDGINWTTKMVWGYSEYKGVTWDSLYYGNGKFVAIGTDYYSNPNTLITYSTDGINWTTKEIWSNDDYTYLYWRSLCYGNGKFVAVGSSGHITYSTDGINWSMSQVDTSESGSGKPLTSVCYGNGKFYSFFEYSSGMRIAVSSNGVDWEVQNSKIDVPVSDILYVEYYNGIYVGLISPSFLSYSVIASFDGISWEVVHSSDKRLYCMKIAQ